MTKITRARRQLNCTINFTVLSCLPSFVVTLLVAESNTHGHPEKRVRLWRLTSQLTNISVTFLPQAGIEDTVPHAISRGSFWFVFGCRDLLGWYWFCLQKVG